MPKPVIKAHICQDRLKQSSTHQMSLWVFVSNTMLSVLLKIRNFLMMGTDHSAGYLMSLEEGTIHSEISSFFFFSCKNNSSKEKPGKFYLPKTYPESFV